MAVGPMDTPLGVDRLGDLAVRVALQGVPVGLGPEESALLRIAFARFKMEPGELAMAAHLKEVVPRWQGGATVVMHTEERLSKLTTEDLLRDPRLQRALATLSNEIDWESPAEARPRTSVAPTLGRLVADQPMGALALPAAYPQRTPIPFAEMLAAFHAARMGRSSRDAASQIPTILGPDERLLAFAQANGQRSLRKVVLVLTSRRLLVVGGGHDPVLEETALPQIVKATLGLDLLRRPKLTIETLDLERDFVQLAPRHQGERIGFLLGGPKPSPELLSLLVEMPEDPLHPPLAFVDGIQLYSDRLIDGDGRHLPFAGGDVRAQADSAGNIAVTRGRNLANKGIGTLMFGPIGLFGMGNAKEKVTDARELYLLIEGPGWAYAKAMPPDLGEPVRHFAATVNAVSRRLQRQSPEPAATPPRPASDLAGELRELAALRDEGLLTDEEFNDQKRRLLS